ncbi:CG7441, partial [Drosophila busckii]
QHKMRWPRKVFSGIQPTGSMHLGNYLGAVRKWIELQTARDDVTLCIVDMHSITMPHNPPVLRENIFTMAATLLACGVDPSQSTLFVQSAVMEHSEFNWILSSLCTMPRLAQLPQFKEKSRTLRDVPLGLYVYPVLQAADIMLYKSTHVPVGVDQLQHIQLAQHLARTFNTRYGEMFPVCNPMIEENEASRILSLRDTSKKMSKSDLNPKGTINLCDNPDQIAEKIKKALTDFTSDISFSPSMRPGVSNLVNIHAQVTGQTIKQVVSEANTLDTAKYKERVSEAVIEHLRPIREKIQQHLANRNELIYMLEMGADKARQTAQQTMSEVRQRLGLGTNVNMPACVHLPPPLPEHNRLTAAQRLSKGVLMPDVNAHTQPHFDQRTEPGNAALAVGGNAGESTTSEMSQPRLLRRPVVPLQTMRVEKFRNKGPPRHVFKMDSYNTPNIGFRAPTTSSGKMDFRDRHSTASAANFGFSIAPDASMVNSISGFKYSQHSSPSAVASITSQVNAATKQQELVSSLANSAYYKAAATAFNNTNPNVINMAAGAVSASNRSNSTTSGNTASPAIEEEEAVVEEQEDEEELNAAAPSESTKVEN